MAINLNKLLMDEDKYNSRVEKMFKQFEEDYNTHKDMYVEVKINGELYEMFYPNLLTNLILLKPFLVFKEELDLSFVWFEEQWIGYNAGDLDKYQDKIYNYFKDKVNLTDIKMEMAHIQEGLEKISMKFTIMEGISISLYDKYRLAKKNKRYNEILHTDITDDMPTNKIESYLKELTDELLEILKTEDNDLMFFARTGEGLNAGQLQQMEINIGTVANMEGKLIPKVINTNFLRGLRSPSDMFAESIKGRNSAVINSDVVEQSGYFNRKLTILCMNTFLAAAGSNCETDATYSMFIDSQQTLNRFKGRYYRTVMSDKEYKKAMKRLENSKEPVKFEEELRQGIAVKMVDTEDESLIGKTLHLYTPIKCSHEEGYVCDKCYGALAEEERNRHIGIKGINNLTEKLTQMLLSSKHILKTVSEVIKWKKSLKSFFNIDIGEIYIKPEVTEQKYTLRILKLDFSEDFESSDFSYINKFYMVDASGTYQKISSEKILGISREFLEKMDYENGEYIIKTKDIPFDEPVFSFTIENHELSRPLKNIMKLIEQKEHMECKTIDEIMRKFIDLLNESNIGINAVDAEIIIRNLIRSPYDETRRPLFEVTGEDPEYIIEPIAGIKKTNSLVQRLVFEDIKRQLLTPDTYHTDGVYLLDPLFLNKTE